MFELLADCDVTSATASSSSSRDLRLGVIDITSSMDQILGLLFVVGMSE